MLVAQLCLTLCNPIDRSPPGPSAHGILQARTLEWVAVSFFKRNYRKKESEVAQECPTLCDPMNYSLPGSSIHGIFQAGILEWVAISFSHSDGYIFLFLLCLLLLFFSQLFIRPPHTTILPSCISFPWGWFWLSPPVQCHKPVSIVLQALYQI